MRDFERFRARFFAAVGLLSASLSPACEAKKDDAGQGSGTSDLAKAEDAIGASDGSDAGDAADAADGADSADGVDGAVATDSADGVDGADSLDGADAADGDADVVSSDGTPDVIELADLDEPDVPPFLDTWVEPPPDIPVLEVDELDIHDAGQPSVCEFGEPQEICYSATELQVNIDTPPQGGKPGGAAYAGPLPPEGCPDPNLVHDGCCNPGVGEAKLVGDTCCYIHCTGACCGRPLEIAGQARTAPLKSRTDWLTAEGEPPTDLSPETRRALALAWRLDARDEHASVASFQRFGLDLLALGAPADLVMDAVSAAADEVNHARIAFGIAARLDGEPVGPGQLNLTGLVVRGDLASAAAAAAHEGCVGETLAAVAVGAAARQCTDPVIAASLRQIAGDEARHAELAWRFVSWAVQAGGATVHAAVAEAFAAATAESAPVDARELVLTDVPANTRRRFGRLLAGETDRLRQRTLVDIIAPCAASLLAGRLDRTDFAARAL